MILEIAVLLLFSCMLIACIALDISILFALGAGFILFFLYCLKQKFSVKEILKMNVEGVLLIKNMLLTFLLIGALTALWRASGTIPSIVAYTSRLFSPSIFIMLTFVMNCVISFLTGTSFGTAATMGTICMTMAVAMNMNPALIGGAILSGAFFGDRCSPVSTSALLVAQVTETNSFKNLKLMFKSALIPFILTCIVYLVMGFLIPHNEGKMMDVSSLFSSEFVIGILPLIPAAVIVVMSLFKINVRLTLIVSIAVSIILCVFYQKMEILSIIDAMFNGYKAKTPELSGVISGGGVFSMIKMMCIVTLSSSFSGIFKKTKLMEPIRIVVRKLSHVVSQFALTLIVSIVTVAVACNQTLGIMLTQQLCEKAVPDKQKLAIYMEDTVVIIAPLIPWCIAGAVPLAMVGAPASALLAACYLYLLPLYNLAAEAVKSRRHLRNLQP